MSKDDVGDFINSMSDFFNDEIMEKNKYIHNFSKGNQKKICIAAALAGYPEILILDEPFTAIQEEKRRKSKLLKIKDSENDRK